MLFNAPPWQMQRERPQLVGPAPGFYGVSCYDSFIEKIFLDLLPRGRGEKRWIVVSGRDMAPDWPEVHLRELDLFCGLKSYVILDADHICAPAWEQLTEMSEDLGERFVVTFFSAASKRFTSSKKGMGTWLKIEAPRFWEGDKLLSFLCQIKGLALTPPAKHYLLDSLPHQTGGLWHALNLLALYFPKRASLTPEQVQSVISPRHLDHFKMASLFEEKKWKAFFEALMKAPYDFDTLRSFFAFMQTHLGKLLDPSYAQQKARVSQYDKKILSRSPHFQRKELLKGLRFFGQLELLCKQKSPQVSDILRKQWINRHLPC